MNFLRRLAVQFQLAVTYRPYFSNKERDMAFLILIDENVSQNIKNLYEEIKNDEPSRFAGDISLYESFLEKAKKHNEEIRLINSYVDSFTFNDFLAKPEKYDEHYIQQLIGVSGIISKYRTLPAKHEDFVDGVNKIKNDYDVICAEHKLIDEYDKLLVLDGYEYIDNWQKAQILNRIKGFLPKLPRQNNHYYSFDKHLNIDSLISVHNEKYIADASNNPIFDNINGRSLDKEQRQSVLTDEVSTLVVAGAGSGKTLTICGKVEYLLKEKGVDPSQILLLSYSKKSADDLQTKINKIDDRLTVGTFHKIGLDILKETQNKTFMVEDQYKAIIEAYFREEMKNRPNMLQTVLTYYALYITSTKHDKKYENEGDLYEDLKKSDFSTLKCFLLSLTEDFNARETIKKELVKSFEEMAIANWYFINGIDYIYESPYEHDVSTLDKRQYMPDFKLTKYPIYHEHYGIDRKGNASQFEGLEAIEYVHGMQWKEKIHSDYGTDCIETYSYEFDNGTVFKKLEIELKKRGVKFNPLSNEQIYNALNSIYESKTFKSFINLTKTFLSLYKSTYRDASGFDALKNYNFDNHYNKNRASLFLDIVKDIYNYYMDYLRNEGKIDFDDMILKSIEELDHTKGYKYQYIIVDEFQDISVSRMKFLKRLIQQGNSKLFAVGDDWQAIYRFSGCDLNIFLEFPKYFGASAITKITTTHRNSQELQNIAGPFIKKNPEQFNKSINSTRHLEHPIQIMYYTEKKYYAFLDVLREISKKDSAAKVLILGRNNKDLEDIELDNRIFVDYKASDENNLVVKCTSFPKMQLTYSTVHGSKGLEEDYVILINADEGRIGFPNKMEDDELLDMVLSHKSEYEYAEERRLWYVALTRTRTYTYIIANSARLSIFLEEIKGQCLVMNQEDQTKERKFEMLCPRCKSGRLVLRANGRDNTEFYGCSNYPYCNYSIDDMTAVRRNKRCANCNDFMIFKKGRYGAFFGCHSYPRCTYKEPYDPDQKR